MEQNQNYCRDHQRVIRIKFRDHSDFIRQSLKKLAVVERLIWLLGRAVMAFAVVERVKQESMSAGRWWSGFDYIPI